MSFRLGLVGLCTSHPSKWVPIIRQLTDEGSVDVEVCAAWDSGQTRPSGFAETFAQEFNIPKAVANLEGMIDLVDGVIVHTADWDRHIEQARPFVEAGKSVLIDKPIVGNLRDARQFLEWAEADKRVTGGSSLRFAYEVHDYLAQPTEERGQLHTVFAGCGTDEFNYGIHAYSLLSGLLGPGIRSVQYLGTGGQNLFKVNCNDARIGLLSVGEGPRIPFHATVVTDKDVTQIIVDPKHIYRDLLEKCLPYLCGQVDAPPLTAEVLLEPELTAMAARISQMNDGKEIALTELPIDDPGYDGAQFAAEYRRARMTG